MTSSNPSAPAPTGSRRFILEMLGFPDAEKSMLASTFRLTGRRALCYAEATEPEDRPDIYLINADSPEGLRALEERSPSMYAPAMLIGRTQADSNWPQMSKPIQWMRLFEQL